MTSLRGPSAIRDTSHDRVETSKRHLHIAEPRIPYRFPCSVMGRMRGRNAALAPSSLAAIYSYRQFGTRHLLRFDSGDGLYACRASRWIYNIV